MRAMFANAQREAEGLRMENARLKNKSAEAVLALEKENAEAVLALEKENERLKVDLGALNLRAIAAEENLQAKHSIGINTKKAN